MYTAYLGSNLFKKRHQNTRLLALSILTLISWHISPCMKNYHLCIIFSFFCCLIWFIWIHPVWPKIQFCNRFILQITHQTTAECQTSLSTLAVAAFRWTILNTFWTSNGEWAITTPSESRSFTAAHPRHRVHPQSIQSTLTGCRLSPVVSGPTLASLATDQPFLPAWMGSSIRGWTLPTFLHISEYSGGRPGKRATTTNITTTSRGWNERCSRSKLQPHRPSQPRLPGQHRCLWDRREQQLSQCRRRRLSPSSWCHLRPLNTKRLFKRQKVKSAKYWNSQKFARAEKPRKFHKIRKDC